jgi:hypothetical protein
MFKFIYVFHACLFDVDIASGFQWGQERTATFVQGSRDFPENRLERKLGSKRKEYFRLKSVVVISTNKITTNFSMFGCRNLLWFVHF